MNQKDIENIWIILAEIADKWMINNEEQLKNEEEHQMPTTKA